MNQKPLLAGFFSRFSIAYAVVVGAVLSTEALEKRYVYGTSRGLRGSFLLAGIFFGGIILGRLADLRGRLEALIISTIIRTLGTALTPLMPSYSTALLMRFVAGFGIGGSMASTAAYVSERSPIEKRGRNVVLMESMRARGSTASGVIAYIIIKKSLSRSLAFYFSILLGLITLLLLFSSPETPIRSEKLGEEKPIFYAFLVLTLAIRYVRFVAGFTYYYRLYTSRDVLSKLGSTGVSGIAKLTISLAAQLIGYTYAYLLIDRVGRRPVLGASLLLGALSLPLYYYSPLLAGILFVAFNVGVRGTIYTYTPEAYPTGIRSTALGSAVSVARVGAFLGPLVGEYAIYQSVSLRIAILSIVHLSALISLLFLPETKEKSLERFFRKTIYRDKCVAK